MKIAYILHNKTIDGSFISWMNLAQSLSQKGCEIVVICPPELENNPFFTNFIKAYHINVYYAFIYLSFVGRRTTKNNWIWYKKHVGALKNKFQSLIQIIGILKKEQPSIVHTNVGIIHEGYFAATIMNIPHVWHLREYQDLDWGYWIYPTKKLFCRLLRRTNVITISNSVKSYFNLDTYKSAHTIYNGICPEHETVFVEHKDKYFLSACTISENKGVRDIILAFIIFHKNHPEYRLYIVGDDRNVYAEELKTLVNTNDMSQHIIFTGYKIKEDVYKYMQSAKALVVASYNEAFGRMTAEAAFNGTIPIARNTGGTKEILDTLGGVPFDGDYNNLAEKMEFVHNMSEDKYNRIISNAQQIAQEKYSIERNIAQIINLYNGLI